MASGKVGVEISRIKSEVMDDFDYTACHPNGAYKYLQGVKKKPNYQSSNRMGKVLSSTSLHVYYNTTSVMSKDGALPYFFDYFSNANI